MTLRCWNLSLVGQLFIDKPGGLAVASLVTSFGMRNQDPLLTDICHLPYRALNRFIEDSLLAFKESVCHALLS